MLLISLLTVVLLRVTAGQAPAPPSIPASPPQGYGYVLGYDALISLYNAYKYGAPLSALQVPYKDSLFYIACQTLAASPGDNVIYLHPTFPLGTTISNNTQKFPLAINLATAVNQAAYKYLGDRQLFQADYPYGPSGTGTTPTFRKYVIGITIYGTLNDTGKIFTCSTGTQALPLS